MEYGSTINRYLTQASIDTKMNEIPELKQLAESINAKLKEATDLTAVVERLNKLIATLENNAELERQALTKILTEL